MKKIGWMLVALTGLSLGLAIPLLTAAGPWGPQGCPVGTEATQATVPSFQANLDGWYTFPKVSTWEYLYEKGWLVSAKNPATGEVQKWDRLRKIWEKVVGPRSEDIENFGIALDEMKKPRPAYIVSGQACSRDDLREILDTPDGLPNDKDKPWIIAVGDDDYLKRVAGDVEKSSLRQLVRFQGLKPDSFHAKKFNLEGFEPFVRTHTALLVVLPDEKVIHLQTTYQGPKDIKDLEEALDPAKIPDIRKPTPSNPLDWSLFETLFNKFLAKVEEEPIVWLAGMVILVLLLRKPSK